MTSQIALRNGLHRNQLYGWRREFRAAAAADAGVPGSEFVPIVVENRIASGPAAIEVETSGAIVRVGPGVDPALLGEVIRLSEATA